MWLDTFQVQTSELLSAYAPQDLATTSYALAKFAYRPQTEWLRRLEEVALLKEDDFTEQALAIAAWSVLVLDTGRICDRLLARAVRAPQPTLNSFHWQISGSCGDASRSGFTRAHSSPRPVPLSPQYRPSCTG